MAFGLRTGTANKDLTADLEGLKNTMCRKCSKDPRTGRARGDDLHELVICWLVLVAPPRVWQTQQLGWRLKLLNNVVEVFQEWDVHPFVYLVCFFFLKQVP